MVAKNIKRAENSYFILYSKYVLCMFLWELQYLKLY